MTLVFFFLPFIERILSSAIVLLPTQMTKYFGLFLQQWDIQCFNVEVGKILGEGGGGTVYQCAVAGHSVAIKRDTKKKEMEITLRAQNHKNIIQMFGCFAFCAIQDAKYLNMVLEEMECDLWAAYSRTEQSFKEIGSMMIQVASGVAHLHDRNIVHRDIKCENVLFKQGVFKICDFGVAEICNPGEGLSGCCGTEDYMAPEVLANRTEYNRLVDTFSFGLMLFELICGEEIEDSARTADTRYSFPKDYFYKRIPGDCPYELAKLVNDCCAPLTYARPEFSAIVARLEAYVAGCSVVPTSSTPVRSKKRPSCPELGLRAPKNIQKPKRFRHTVL